MSDLVQATDGQVGGAERTDALGPPADLAERVAMGAEARAHEAHALQAGIKGCVRNIRRAWIEMGRYLYEFHAMKGWEALGYDTQEEWLAQAEIGIHRTQAFRLRQAYRELCIDRQVSVERLGEVDPSRVWEILPAIRRGQVDAERALADAEVLGEADLRERYARMPVLPSPGDEPPIEPDDWHWESCPSCGSRIRVHDTEEPGR